LERGWAGRRPGILSAAPRASLFIASRVPQRTTFVGIRLVAGGVVAGGLVCAVPGLLAYAILARIDQGFAVFG
jgi:hypothetical protein